MLTITNPATGKVIAEVPDDTPGSVKRKYQIARARAWRR